VRYRLVLTRISMGHSRSGARGDKISNERLQCAVGLERLPLPRVLAVDLVSQ